MTDTANNPTEANTSSQQPVVTETVVSTEPGKQQEVTSLLTQVPASETPETKTEPEAKTEPEKTPEGAPEKYEFKAPEGTEYDAQVIEKFSDAAKEANLTQDAAQKLLEKVAPAIAARQQEQIDAVKTGWLDSSKTDKEFGGEKLNENLATAKKALDSFGTPELHKLLDDSGLGNHPEVIRHFYRVGKAISQDTFVGGAPSGKGTPDLGAILYPNTPKKE